MAVENIIGHRPRRRWAVAFGFGLAHGFGFSFVLAETLQFAGSHLVASLLAFNVGVEIGQLVIVVIAMPLLGWIFRVWDVGRVGNYHPLGLDRAHRLALDDRQGIGAARV